ncbi:UNKNOWN [Stylonychia lemnae]|uniref:Uncharacterized protein n=1 Tax=Stylonychia lemnae TaxID=5949 RepID=A0A078A8E9_STYLE|nr:UNKNOWN [Stylonychia lemnae]|eukprot:CDW77056.1 UNKNOWN [Stylonychia lemnae]
MTSLSENITSSMENNNQQQSNEAADQQADNNQSEQPTLVLKFQFGTQKVQTPSQKFLLMLNKIDIKNFDKVIKSFNFDELIHSEKAFSIAHTVCNKVNNQISTQIENIDQEIETFDEFFTPLVVMMLENEDKLSKQEAKYTEKLINLNRIDQASRTEEQKQKIEEKERKQKMTRQEILLGFKFIAELVQKRLIEIQNISDILRSLVQLNENHLDFFNLGKIVIILCTLANIMYLEGNEEILQHLTNIIDNSKKSIEVYCKREQIASEQMIIDLRELNNRKFVGVYEVRNILRRIYQTVYGSSIQFAEFPCIMFNQNH